MAFSGHMPRSGITDHIVLHQGFPGDSDSKESVLHCICSDSKELHCICIECMLSCVLLFMTPWTVASMSMELSRQEYWSGLPFPTPEYLPNPGIKHSGAYGHSIFSFLRKLYSVLHSGSNT